VNYKYNPNNIVTFNYITIFSGRLSIGMGRGSKGSRDSRSFKGSEGGFRVFFTDFYCKKKVKE